MIFVHIAAYRDPELIPTLLDCLAKAKYPKRLTFGICWQHHQNDNSLAGLRRHKQFRIDDVGWEDSAGSCWARAKAQGFYNGEEFSLQLDSHHRFIAEWDVKLVKMLEKLDSRKPALTTFGAEYSSERNCTLGNAPCRVAIDECRGSDGIYFKPLLIHNWAKIKKPIATYFAAAHFFFTSGLHCEECKHDPQLYSGADDISLSVRSYTHGYDLFHPHLPIVWHEYVRPAAHKHWDDHVFGSQQIHTAWEDRVKVSLLRLKKLLRLNDNDQDLSGFDLGSKRSLSDYFERSELCRFLSNETSSSTSGTRNALALMEIR